MNEIINLKDSIGISAEQLDIPFVLLNFLACILISYLLRIFYIRYSISLTGKYSIGAIIPILSAVVFLVIVVVKSSLALSLGLVGALSIVRFRTPIKEPEELVYLFLAISIGLGCGAGYTLITSIIILLILLFNYFILHKNKNVNTNEYNLIVEKTGTNLELEKIIEIISIYTKTLKLVRIDSGKLSQTIIFSLTFKKDINTQNLLQELKKLPELDLSLYESRTNW